MEKQLIEAIASLKGGKKKLREMKEQYKRQLESEVKMAEIARLQAEQVSKNCEELAGAIELIERLSAREEPQPADSPE